MLLKIKNKHLYKAAYDSEFLRGKDDPNTPRPWNLFQEIKNYSGNNKTLLDIGCGTAFKIIPLSAYFKKIIGIDISKSMLEQARKNIKKEKIENVDVIEGFAENLQFLDHSFDIVTCMLSQWSPSEVRRVLKPQGVTLIEHIGCEDKKEFKLLFGQDKSGWRGQFLEYSKDEFISKCYEAFIKHFETVEVKNGYWDTYYTIEGLNQLLANTPTIRNYSIKDDQKHLKTAISLFSTNHGIKLKQNRILIYAQNPRI